MVKREDIIENVRSFVQEIISSGVPIDKAILFGSYSKNNFNVDSDVDVVLVSPNFNGFGYEDRKLFSKINIKREFATIETKTFPSSYFANGDPFINEILDTGIVVHTS